MDLMESLDRKIRYNPLLYAFFQKGVILGAIDIMHQYFLVVMYILSKLGADWLIIVDAGV